MPILLLLVIAALFGIAIAVVVIQALRHLRQQQDATPHLRKEGLHEDLSPSPVETGNPFQTPQTDNANAGATQARTAQNLAQERHGESRFSRTALVASLLIPWGLPVAWQIVHQTPWGEDMATLDFYNGWLYRYFVLPLGILASVLTTILGSISIRQIQASLGTRWGIGLAVLNAIFYPVVVAMLIVVIIASNMSDQPANARFPIVQLLVFCTPLLLTIWHISRTVKSAFFSATPQAF